VSRRLALGVLNVAQGHPKLLELADGQSSVIICLDRARQICGGSHDVS
jgi:hypothetical protein